MTEYLDAGLELLDRQLLDADGTPLGKVDDLLFTDGGTDGPPVLAALLVGQQAFGARLGGRAGLWWTGLARRLSPGEGPVEVPAELIGDVGTVIAVDARVQAFPRLLGPERWLRRHVVSRLPGGERESD
jgi:sporulation protein YlmC with PRC-barrel domain